MPTKVPRLFPLFFPFLLLPAAAQAVTIHVPSDVADLQTAIGIVGEGDVIEIEAGTYVAPADGWAINDVSRSFTIRAEAPGSVVLSGNGDRRILRFVNAAASDHSVVFEGLIFADGLSTINAYAGGVTLSRADATFVDCEFLNNSAIPSNTGGGAVIMSNDSVAFFFGCRFAGNTAKNEGGALRVGNGTSAYVHRSEFLNNRTNIPNHRTSATGGAIHVTNALLEVSSSRFDSNQGGCNAGAIVAIGTWNEPVTVPAAEVWIANSTFVDNSVEPHPSVTCSFEPSAGAVHGEDQTLVKIFNSRFIGNSAPIGGAIGNYRSRIEIDGSLFRGNRASGTGASGLGGAIMSNSNDAVDGTTGNGTINRPSAELTIRNSLFQGRFGAVGETGLRGGCLYVNGDLNRTFGIGGVPPMGDEVVNRAQVLVSDSVFFDCDVVEEVGTAGTGAGGALSIGHASFTLERSLVAESDATGPTSAAGALRVVSWTEATVTGTTFAYNSAGSRGGAIQVSGSTLNVDDCRFFGNTLSQATLGSVIWSATLINFHGQNIDTAGVVQSSFFTNNSGRYIQEFDNAGGPINHLRYDGNLFLTDPVDSVVFGNQIAGIHDVESLNSLVVTRDPGVGNSVKSIVDNVVLTAEPELGSLLAAPPQILLTHAATDPPPPAESFVAYAWSAAPGTTVELFGLPVAATSGLETAGAGVHDLLVGAETFTTSIVNAAVPEAQLTAVPASIVVGQSSDLSWETTGSFLDVAIDRRVAIASPAASGSATVSPAATTSYRLYALTEEGGADPSATVTVSEVGGGLIFADGFESGDTGAWTAALP